jgi:hypothetical protein
MRRIFCNLEPNEATLFYRRLYFRRGRNFNDISATFRTSSVVARATIARLTSFGVFNKSLPRPPGSA